MRPKSRRAARRAAHRLRVNFSSLPTELRLMIWKYTLRPRILRIERRSHTGRLKGVAPLPIAMQVCRESRAIALKHYKPAFLPPNRRNFRASTRIQRATYFNPDLDAVHVITPYVLYANPHHALSATLQVLSEYSEETARMIKVLAYETGDLTLFPHSWQGLAKFESLEEIIFVGNWSSPDLEADFLASFRKMLGPILRKGQRLPAVREVVWQAFREEWS